VLETAFAIEGARQALRAPGVEGLLFAVDRGEKGLEVVSIRKMVRSTEGVYFADIEALRVLPGYGPTLHLFARYGKLEGGMILLHAVDAEAQWRSEQPRVYLATDTGEVTVTLDPGLEPDVLEYVNPDPRALRAVPAGVLWGMRSWARRTGLLQEAVELELVLFFVRPAMFLALSLSALAVAWRYRARYYGRPSIIAFSSLAAFPFAVAGVWWLLTDAARLLYAGSLIALGFIPTAIVAAAVQSLLVLVALVTLARNTVD
jgi:hypothetical protein